MDNRKEFGIQKRKKITLYSLRRHAKTVISDQAGQDYSEWFIGHAKSPYWGKKEEARREIYQTKIMNYLTFLDYGTLETTGKNIEKQLVEKDKQIENLKEMDKIKSEEMQLMNERMNKRELEYQLEYRLTDKRITHLESMINNHEADERKSQNKNKTKP